MIAISLNELFYRKPKRPSRRKPLSPDRRARIVNWARRTSREVVANSLEVSLQCGSMERAALLQAVLATTTPSVPKPQPVAPTRTIRLPSAWRPIVDEVAKAHRVAQRDMLSGVRKHRLVAARNELWHRLHKERGISFSEIGRRTGNYHHTTIMHGVRQWAAREEEKCAT